MFFYCVLNIGIYAAKIYFFARVANQCSKALTEHLIAIRMRIISVK